MSILWHSHLQQQEGGLQHSSPWLTRDARRAVWALHSSTHWGLNFSHLLVPELYLRATNDVRDSHFPRCRGSQCQFLILIVYFKFLYIEYYQPVIISNISSPASLCLVLLRTEILDSMSALILNRITVFLSCLVDQRYIRPVASSREQTKPG